MELRRVRIIVTGRVQGVFYRATCAHMARKNHVNGWVKNNPDGRVEAVFEGTKKDVEFMIKWAQKGPEYAIIQNIQILEENPQKIKDFVIED
ncbi:MAG: acylphosphatase [Planctomycetes bacterium]|nr:acylphosphatase [Planctomycetota bacterium]